MTRREAVAFRLAWWALRLGGLEFRRKVMNHLMVGEFVVDARAAGLPMSQIEIFE
jgi:hypothetical protein